MTRFAESEHTPVYSKASADEIGRITRYIVTPESHTVAALHVSGRRSKALLADWEHVVGFGPDAVVIDDEQHLRHPNGDYEERVAAGDLDLRGRRVLTDTGYEIGVLVDVEFDESTGELTVLETDRTTISGDGLTAIGPYAVVVRQDAVRPVEEPPAE
ncbi:hypothetical protein BH23ACT10_BH23ACT10_16880 [soil metagenome]